jgi:exodeoxyribonuclease VII large subunit
MLVEPKVRTVSELTQDIKLVLECAFEEVVVEGEISNLRKPSSGHNYFSLKDSTAQIKCVLFKGDAAKIKFSFADGMQVVCHGRVGVYERDGQYQLYVARMEPKGQGALQLAFMQLKEKLAQEGFFDESHKRPLPFLPKVIGVITSPTGAVIRDILHVLERRFHDAHVVIYPVRVQGDEASGEIVQAIEDMNNLKEVEVLILARGGGSLEDLWCFNEENVARAIYKSDIPVISAIGHETDFTIADFVADRRAPTPSAAAEIVLPSRQELEEKIQHLMVFLKRSLEDIVPQNIQRIDDLREAMYHALDSLVANSRVRLEGLINELNALSPLAVLKRGYSITTRFADNRVLQSACELKKGDRVKTKLSEGTFVSEIEEIASR